MSDLIILNAELSRCKTELEAIGRKVAQLIASAASCSAIELLPELDRAASQLRDTTEHLEAATRAIAGGAGDRVH